MDLGGGLGVPYEARQAYCPPLPDVYGAMVRGGDRRAGTCTLHVRAGARDRRATAGVLLYQGHPRKAGRDGDPFVIDRRGDERSRCGPALYDAYHDFLAECRASMVSRMTAHIVGPICESSGDTFAKNREMDVVSMPKTSSRVMHRRRLWRDDGQHL